MNPIYLNYLMEYWLGMGACGGTCWVSTVLPSIETLRFTADPKTTHFNPCLQVWLLLPAQRDHGKRAGKRGVCAAAARVSAHARQLLHIVQPLFSPAA